MSAYRYPTAARALRGGFVEALGAPALVLGAGYIGFGALSGDAGIPLLLALVSTVTIFALPAQIAMVEMWQLATPIAALVLAVAMTNARFLPMAATLMPQLRHPRWTGWHYALAAHCVAMSGWAIAMRRNAEMEPAHRLPFFCGFTFGLWLACLVGTAAGYHASGNVPAQLTVGLVFLNPIYFILILARETRTRIGVVALGCGAVAGPPVHMWIPEWSLILGGTLAGIVAFVLLELGGRHGR